MSNSEDRTVSFTRLDQGTTDEHIRVRDFNRTTWRENVGKRVMEELREIGEIPLIVKVNELEHSLQTATRCLRDGEDEETVVCALVHDIGEKLGPANHGEFAASLLRPYISEANYAIVKYHPIFQGYYFWHHTGRDPNGRDNFRNEPWYDRCVRFCERWDMPSFDPNYDSLPLDYFEPMVMRTFGRTPYSRGHDWSGTFSAKNSG
jgi:predicted HD phosphohydrolase